MKTNISIRSTILMLLFTTSSFAQYNMKEMYVFNAEHKLLEMPYANSEGEKGISIFKYDKNGKLESSFWKLLDGSRSSNNFYTYNKQGNIIKKYREFSDGITSTEHFTYDSKNRLLTEEFNRSDGFTNKTIYIYDELGRVEKCILENYHGWLNGEIQFDYRKNNQVIKGNILRNGAQIGFVEFAYDDIDQIKSEHWEFSGAYTQNFTFNYEQPLVYSSSNVFITNADKYRIISENYNFNNESGGPSLYFYAENNKLEKKIFKVDGKVKTITKYFYDSEGLLTHSIRTLNDGNENIFRYKYNKNRQLTDRINYLKDSIIGEEHYSYQNKKLIGGEYENFDYWLNGSLSFEHDKNGNLEKGFFKGKDGFDAQIFFTTNKDGNITKVHWEFSFGKTQTYEFEYENINNY